MRKDIEPRDFKGDIIIDVRSHGILTRGYFVQKTLLNRWLARPDITVSGAPHLNSGEETKVSLTEGTVEDYLNLVRGIYPNAKVAFTDRKNDSNGKQALRDGRIIIEREER